MCAALIFAFGTSALADNTDIRSSLSAEEAYGHVYSDDAAAVLEEAPLTDSERALIRMVSTAIWNGETQITFNGSDYGVTFDRLSAVARRLYLEPETFAMANVYFGSSGGKLYFAPVYNADIYSDYDTAKALYLNTVAEIAALVDDSWSDLEKVLFVHDHLALNYDYDTTYTNYDAYSFFRDKRGVCQAYMRAFNAIMAELGVESSYVESESLDHVWNIVKINGKWYHMDVTWDDPLSTSVTNVDHMYFIISTDKMYALDHVESYDWQYGLNVTCSDTAYDNCFWSSDAEPRVASSFLNDNGKWYFVTDSGIGVWDGHSSGPSVLASFSDIYAELYPQYSFGVYLGTSGLSCLNDKLYLNTAFDALEYDLTTKQAKSLASVIGGSTNICASYLDGAYIVYQTTDNMFYRVPLDVYTNVEDGGYGYYTDNGKLNLKVGSKAFVIAVWYDAAGKMIGCRIINTAGEYSLDVSASYVKLISLDIANAPLCETVKLYVQ